MITHNLNQSHNLIEKLSPFPPEAIVPSYNSTHEKI